MREEHRRHDRQETRAAGNPSARAAARRPTQAPTQALRVKVSATATTSAGMTSAAQVRSRCRRESVPAPPRSPASAARNRSCSGRACPAAAGRGCRSAGCRTDRSPTMALTAPTVTMTVISVCARLPARDRVDRGTTRKRNSCLQSARLRGRIRREGRGDAASAPRRPAAARTMAGTCGSLARAARARPPRRRA